MVPTMHPEVWVVHVVHGDSLVETVVFNNHHAARTAADFWTRNSARHTPNTTQYVVDRLRVFNTFDEYTTYIENQDTDGR